jgi:hypothetical protein
MAFWILLSYSLGALVFALAPSLLQDLGSTSWLSPMIALAAFHASGLALCLRRHFQLAKAGIPTSNIAVWVVASIGAILTMSVLLTGAVGAFGGPSYRLYHLGVVTCLLVAVMSFVGFLRLRDTAA